MSNPERCVRCGRLGAAGGSTTLFKEVRKMLKIYRWRLASLVMALTAIVGLALPALGDDERPFGGHADEMIIDGQPVADGLLVTATGAGQATHLGRFTRLGMVVIHGADGSVEGTVVFTAANGDQLFIEAKGVPAESGYAQHSRWDLHVHWGDRPVQRRVGRGGVPGGCCVRWYSYHRRVRGHHTVLRGGRAKGASPEQLPFEHHDQARRLLAPVEPSRCHTRRPSPLDESRDLGRAARESCLRSRH